MRFFLLRLPPDTLFNNYLLPARGPLFNADAALIQRILDCNRYWCFQTVATVFNTFCVIPLALLLRDVGKVRQPLALVLAVLACGFLPFFVWHELYTWPKLLATAFILGGHGS